MKQQEKERRRDMHAPIHALFAEKISRMHSRFQIRLH